MVTGIDEGSPGGKTKVMSMQEGQNDITTNDYRYTVEKRGRDYLTLPGAIAMRVIDGDAENEGRIHDTRRVFLNMSDSHWYFFRTAWNHSHAELEIKDASNGNRTVYDSGVGLVHAYRPTPHYVHIGAPLARNGHDATVPGMIVKNVWISSRPRPDFPEFTGQ